LGLTILLQDQEVTKHDIQFTLGGWNFGREGEFGELVILEWLGLKKLVAFYCLGQIFGSRLT
jgi:hypothetical protein